MKKYLSLVFIVTLALILATVVQAAPSVFLNYQGYLAVATDTLPYTGQADMQVSVYDAETVGSLLWTETHNNVDVTKGFYNIVLGKSAAIDPAMFDVQGRYLEVSVNGEALAPRKLLTSVAHSLRSFRADEASNADYAGSATNATNATNAVHAIRADSATYATTAGSAPVGSHNHMGQKWSVNPGLLGLSMRIDAASASQVYGYVDTVYNTGTGATYGMALNTYGNSTGIRRGIYSIVDNGSSGAAWAGNFETNNSSFGTGERIAVRAFAGRPYDGATLYGVHSTCWPGTAHNGEAYGGYFNVDGGSASSIKYGVYATATGSGTNYAGYFAGNLTTTGKLNFASTYVPTGSADANGSVGDIAYDATYIYVKTASGWRRAAFGATW